MAFNFARETLLPPPSATLLSPMTITSRIMAEAAFSAGRLPDATAPRAIDLGTACAGAGRDMTTVFHSRCERGNPTA
jgi:hypothetical protein